MITRVLLKNKNFKFSRLFSTVVQQEVARSDAVEYPVIEDVSTEAKRIKKKLEWREKIKRVPTIEEKIIELNIPRYYGYKCLMLENNDFPYNSMPFIQYVTKTEFEQLPESIKDEKEAKKIDGFLELIKSDIQDALEFEIDAYKNSFEIDGAQKLTKEQIERAKVSRLVKQLNRVIVNALGADNRHLYEADVDIDPRIEAFWFVGKFIPPLNVQRFRKPRPHLKDYVNDPVDRPIQYVGNPLLTMRHQYPLESFEDINFDAMTKQNENIPMESIYSVDPLAHGYHTFHRHGVSVPGFWPGNVREYGLLSYHDRTHLIKRSHVLGIKDDIDALHSQGILSSFAWTYAQSCYQGFSTYNDMTYPLTTQTVITDGQHWSFYKYQLNTTITHTELDTPNYKYNKCWGTNEMKLYEHIDENGKIHGMNDEVLKQLLRLYINEPKSRNYEMKPYLDPKEKKIADIEDVDRRQWLETIYKYLVSNRPRQYLVPEIYHWENIYKIKFQTMPLDKKLRFFEYGINPFQRQLNEHIPEYIPRDLRANGPHDKKKRRATYYPLDHCSNDPRIMSHSEYGAAKDGIRKKYDRFKKTFK
ncbi:large ribosomal subunit protein mL65 [Chironomus tepperi]|uniref:large ribosomal subunit protein mL65 n=1 Tax=Chironomus tepperi TaxID=113505 RepID=UPI00391FA0FD